MGTAKFTALDIANFYICAANSTPGDSIDNLKLNKLLYFAQGRFLSELGRPLFSDEIQAWDYGPVVPSVYHTFKICGQHSIESPQADVNETRMTSEEIDLLLDIYDNYGKYTGVALKNMTHKKGTPWQSVYVKGANNVIEPSAMKEWFDKDSDFHRFKLDFSKADIITKCPIAWDSNEDAAYDVQ